METFDVTTSHDQRSGKVKYLPEDLKEAIVIYLLSQSYLLRNNFFEHKLINIYILKREATPPKEYSLGQCYDKVKFPRLLLTRMLDVFE